jgi:aerobic-type carbon monoxide dehydrogenase small subunit (CoxS/CutS family)
VFASADALKQVCFLAVNGKPVEIDVPPATRLLDLLSETLGLTGKRVGRRVLRSRRG